MTSKKQITKDLLKIHGLLLDRSGPLDWWPGDTPFEVMVGSILTQNTAWTNVEKAINALKEEDALDPQKIVEMDIRKLKKLIRPSGYFNQKADRLRIFSRYFLAAPYKGDISKMAEKGAFELRDELLRVKGVGPETADSILLYAVEKPVFVVDAYTRRVFSRLGYLPKDVDYQTTQDFFTAHLPKDIKLYNEYHAQIVYLGKDYCRPKPKCQDCPLYPLDKCGDFLE